MAKEVSLGVFEFERETKRTKRFAQETDDGTETQYVKKAVLKKLGDPDKIEIVVRVVE